VTECEVRGVPGAGVTEGQLDSDLATNYRFPTWEIEIVRRRRLLVFCRGKTQGAPSSAPLSGVSGLKQLPSSRRLGARLHLRYSTARPSLQV